MSHDHLDTAGFYLYILLHINPPVDIKQNVYILLCFCQSNNKKNNKKNNQNNLNFFFANSANLLNIFQNRIKISNKQERREKTNSSVMRSSRNTNQSALNNNVN